jgi:NAD(P)-dependent dehydrogenase (short-subunit alcohol dehydrogenase family)
MTQTKIDHPVFTRNAVAVITGGASGIGLAAAKAFAGMGMKVCIADLGAERLRTAANAIAAVSPMVRMQCSAWRRMFQNLTI